MSDQTHDEHNGYEEEQEEVFVVTDEEGNEHEMVMVYTFESEDKAYAVLLDRNDPEAEGVIFRIEEENDAAFLVNIEDDVEWERVVEIYNKIADEEDNA